MPFSCHSAATELTGGVHAPAPQFPAVAMPQMCYLPAATAFQLFAVVSRAGEWSSTMS